MNQSPIQRVFFGFGCVFRGMRHLSSDPKLRRFAFIPFIVDLLLIIVGLTIGFGQLGGFVAAGMSWLGLAEVTGLLAFFTSILSAILWVLMALAFLALIFFAVYLAAGLVAAPFNALLAEKTLMKMGALPNRKFQLGPWLKTTGRLFGVGLVKTFVFLMAGGILAVLAFIPVLNILASFGLFLIMSFDSADYAFESLEMGLRERFAFFSSFRYEFAGCALALGLTLAVPGLNLVLFPAIVVGASDMVARIKSGAL